MGLSHPASPLYGCTHRCASRFRPRLIWKIHSGFRPKGGRCPGQDSRESGEGGATRRPEEGGGGGPAGRTCRCRHRETLSSATPGAGSPTCSGSNGSEAAPGSVPGLKATPAVVVSLRGPTHLGGRARASPPKLGPGSRGVVEPQRPAPLSRPLLRASPAKVPSPRPAHLLHSVRCYLPLSIFRTFVLLSPESKDTVHGGQC